MATYFYNEQTTMNTKFRYRRWTRFILRILMIALIFAGMMLTGLLSLNQATAQCGNIDANDTWTGLHVITCDVWVQPGVTLTISPGAVIKFDGNYDLQIDGELIAQGTSSEPITFTSNASTPAPGDWGYILFTDTSVDAVYSGDDYQSGSIIQYAIIEYAGGASVSDNGALRINESSPFIDHTTIRHSDDNGVAVFFFSGLQRMTYNTITDNAERGIAVRGDTGSIEITHSTIHNNGGSGIFINDITGATIGHNIITGNSASDGGGGIYISSTPATISHNIITANSADNGGGGIYSRQGAVTIENNVIVGNSADQGGGFYVDGTTGSMASFNAILDNQASEDGGGIYAINVNGVSITGNTILGNISGVGGVYIASHPDFNDNNIYDNSGYDLHNGNLTGTADLNAQDNWWGTTDTVQIDDHIWDGDEDSGLGQVDYSPYEDSHNTDAPISPPTGLTITTATTVTSVHLAWSPNPESDLDGYRIYYGLDAGFPYSGTGINEGDSPIDVGSVTAFTLTGLSRASRYYIAVTAYDNAANGTDDQTKGHESWYSDGELANVLPQVPTLSPVDNLDGDGNYLIEWDDATGIVTFTLEEDDNSDFISSTVRYQGPDSQYQVRGRPPGTWWYRVKASSIGGDSSWSDALSVTVESCFIYLPMTIRQPSIYFEGPWEEEPNDSYLEANGPLRSGKDYYGYPDDDRDYFSIDVDTGGKIVIDLSDHLDEGVQLQLFYESVGDLKKLDYTPPYHIEYTGDPGVYYIYIYTASGYSDTEPYTIRVTYP